MAKEISKDDLMIPSPEASQDVADKESVEKLLSAEATPDDLEQEPETTEPMGQSNAYSMRPDFSELFPLPTIKSIINTIMAEKLKDKAYDKDLAKEWTRQIADEINVRISDSPKVRRYKHVVQVMLGQELGAGITYASRCCWDSDCDTSISEVFNNTSLFCVCTVYGTYQY